MRTERKLQLDFYYSYKKTQNKQQNHFHKNIWEKNTSSMLTPTVKEVCQQNLSLGTKVVANSLELVFMAPRKKYLGRLMYHRRSMVHYFFFFYIIYHI